MQNSKKTVFGILSLAVLLFFFGGCAAQGSTPVQKNAVSMGSVVSVKLYGIPTADGEALLAEVLTAISDLDTGLISKNVDASELAVLNRQENPEVPIKVSPELFAAFKETKELYKHADGKAALASGALTALWGMDTEEFRVPTAAEIETARPLCTDDTVILSEDGCVSFQYGQQLNLGSVGKGLGCDKAVEILTRNSTLSENGGAVVSVGGSLALVGSPKNAEPFKIGVRDPFGAENSYLGTLALTNCFVSTSGSYEKKFTDNGKTYHHLLDLTTGYPMETDLCAVTVAAEMGLQSDALSTLCFLLGEEKSLPILKEYGAEAVFVYTDKSVHVTSGLSSVLTITNPAFSLEAAG